MSRIGQDPGTSKLQSQINKLKEDGKTIGGRIIGDAELVAEGPLYAIHDYDEQVSPGLTRGSRLEPGEMQKLKDAGYKGFVDLRAEAPGSDLAQSNETGFEKDLSKAGDALAKAGLTRPTTADVDDAKQVGVNAIDIPIVDMTTPTQAQMVKFLNFATAPENRPCYVHCEAGQGRTGVAVAAYRMAVQGWSADEALADYKAHTAGLQGHEDFIKQFGADLKAGKIAGYPLSPPEASVHPDPSAPAAAPAHKQSWLGKIASEFKPPKDGLDGPAKKNLFQKIESGIGHVATGVDEKAKPFLWGRKDDHQEHEKLDKITAKQVANHLKGMNPGELLHLPLGLAALYADRLAAGHDNKDALKLLEAQLQNPGAVPLSATDQGRIDGVLSRMHTKLSSLQGGLSHDEKVELSALSPRSVTPGDWSAFNAYLDAATGTRQAPGTKVEPLIDGGLVPGTWTDKSGKVQHGRPPYPGLVVPPGTEMKVENPKGAFPTIFNAIDEAKPGEPVYITEFAFQDDDTGRQMAQHLMDAKARGCDVRVIYDPVGSAKSNDVATDPKSPGAAFHCKAYDEMRAAGIPVVPFPTGTGEDHLSHRKIMVIGQTGFIGGMNLGDEYSGIWHDCHSKVTGTGVGDLMDLFTQQYNGVVAEDAKRGLTEIGNPVAFRNREDFVQKFKSTLEPVDGAPTGAQSARVVGHVGHAADQNLRLMFLRAVATAKDRVYVKSPYTSDPALYQALIDAKKRGVPNVVLMVPENNDEGVEGDIARGWYQKLLDSGVEVHTFKANSMDHGKVGVCDNFSWIGSSNWDHRSLVDNDEADITTLDQATADDVVNRLFKKDMEPNRSDRVTQTTINKWNPFDRRRYEDAAKARVLTNET